MEKACIVRAFFMGAIYLISWICAAWAFACHLRPKEVPRDPGVRGFLHRRGFGEVLRLGCFCCFFALAVRLPAWPYFLWLLGLQPRPSGHPTKRAFTEQSSDVAKRK